MKKIRLLTISATCERGGSDINLLRLLRSLDKNEYEIFHLVPYTGPVLEEFRDAGIQVKIVDMPRIRIFKNPIKYIKAILKFLPTVLKIKNIIKNYRIDIICSSSMNNVYGAAAARLADRPHILLAVEYLPILRLASRYFYLFSEKIVCCSYLVGRMFKKSKKVLIEYPCVDLEEFNPQAGKADLREELGATGRLVSMITRLDKWKGVEIFIKAAKYTEVDAKFIIFAQVVVGKEEYLQRLKNLIKELKLEEKVLIKITKCTPGIIAASDIIVHASLRPEPFGLAVIEAMACGKPVIAAKTGGPLEIITEGKDGVLVKAGNPEVLASAISGLLENPQLREEMGFKAREKIVEKFDLKKYAARFDTIFKEALKEYSLKQAQVYTGKSPLVKISAPLSRLLAPMPPGAGEINKDIKKILVIQLFGIGDLICSLPLLEALKGYFDKSKITLLMDARLRELSELMDCQDTVIGYERGILSKLKLFSNIRRERYDLAVVLNPLFQGAWIAYLSRARYRLGYIRDYEGVQDIGALSHLLTHIIPFIKQPMHDSRRYMGIAEFLGIDLPVFFPHLNIADNAKVWADDFIRNNGIVKEDLILGINPNAALESKCWNTDNFAQLADNIIENYNAKVVLFGSSCASDIRRINLIRSAMRHKAVTACGKTDMVKLAALLNRCNVFLSNDSGPMHLAWALGLNVVALFGPSDVNKFGHKRVNIININANRAFCKPCIVNYQCIKKCVDNICMRNIEVSEVIKALEIFIENRKL